MFSSNKPIGFDKIQGYEDIKNIVKRALDSEQLQPIIYWSISKREDTLFIGNTRVPNSCLTTGDTKQTSLLS
jgi:hypothetical protein